MSFWCDEESDFIHEAAVHLVQMDGQMYLRILVTGFNRQTWKPKDAEEV